VSQELGAKNTKNLGNSRKSPSQNRIHPVAVAITRRAGETTRGDFNQYGVLTAEEILNGENFDLSPKEYQNIKLAQLSEFTFIFMAGCVPVAFLYEVFFMVSLSSDRLGYKHPGAVSLPDGLKGHK
jgi:hypothetical protein